MDLILKVPEIAFKWFESRKPAFIYPANQREGQQKVWSPYVRIYAEMWSDYVEDFLVSFAKA